MPRELKVYYGTIDNIAGLRQARCLLATRTLKRAVELLGVSPSWAKNYLMQTRNEDDIRLATSQPETVFYNKNGCGYPLEYVPLVSDQDEDTCPEL